MASSGSSVWCFSCRRFIRSSTDDHETVICSRCGGGFVEEVDYPPMSPRPPRFLAGGHSPDSSPEPTTDPGSRLRRNGMNARDRSPYNPVVVLRRPDGGEADSADYELYYDDNSGLGLRPMPSNAAELLMSSGFDRLLDHLSQLENNGVWRSDKPPASKAAVDSLPTVLIGDSHLAAESHCAICTEQFQLLAEAREMPCKHIYHSACVLPWLALKNSCPVCRHELPTGLPGGNRDDEAVGLTIWRLPGGGFAVGRFTGGRRAGEAEFPLVYTEMDGGLNIGTGGGGVSRGVSWASRGSIRSREHGWFSSTIRNFVSFFGRRQRSSNVVSGHDESVTIRRSQSTSIFGRILSRRGNTNAWTLSR
uniref:RING-type E3 ubiquitin transferase n=1 Tax=Kalanchoe fedtschenkoi TaxID=63787 RepID=A0A7N0U4E5_KALFE